MVVRVFAAGVLCVAAVLVAAPAAADDYPVADGNYTVASPQQPAEYRHSDTLTFTRDVDVLPEGHQLRNGDAFCLVGYQGSVSCTTGEHGFTNYSIFGSTH